VASPIPEICVQCGAALDKEASYGEVLVARNTIKSMAWDMAMIDTDLRFRLQEIINEVRQKVNPGQKFEVGKDGD
jgi:hypothetical protein